MLFGSKGTIDYDGSGSYSVYDLDNKRLATVGSDGTQPNHLANSADPGIRTGLAIDGLSGRFLPSMALAASRVSAMSVGSSPRQRPLIIGNG